MIKLSIIFTIFRQMLVDLKNFTSSNMKYATPGYFMSMGNYNADIKIQGYTGKVI